MSRFNTTTTGSKTTNLAGGFAYSERPELELVSILLTSFANDQFYRKSDDTFAKVTSLIDQCDKKFVAQAAIYARTQFGMRSITHIVASELAKYKEAWLKDFFTAIVYRPDDMTEIISYHTGKGQKISNAMKKGLAKAFDKFDAYQLAKYRGENKGFKLIDIVNMVHPVPCEKNSEALAALVKGDLKSFDTWESELTRAGQNAGSEQEKAEFKKEVWIKLIKEKKIGYFALLRNLRNIIQQAPEILSEALVMLTDEKLIKKSLVLPFRYTTAFEEIKKVVAGTSVREVLIAINKAVDISVSNVPKFDGDTLVVLDVSGSMSGRPAEIGSLFSAILMKSNNADLMIFDDTAKYVNINPMDSTITISESIRFHGGGTNFHSIFKTANRKYDRIIILSDMQGWIGVNSPVQSFNEYCQRTKCNPLIYSFDLQGYGSLQFPEKNVFAIAGFSEKIFDVMALLEKGNESLVGEIKKVTF